MREGGGELVTADESTVVSEPLLDAIVVKDGQGDSRFPDPTRTDESEWGEGFCEVNDHLDKLITSETGPWGRGWGFSRRDAMQM